MNQTRTPPYNPPSTTNKRGDRVQLSGIQQWCGNTRKHWPHYHNNDADKFCPGTANAATITEHIRNVSETPDSIKAILR